MKADVVISALGQEVELDGDVSDIELSRSKTIVCDMKTGQCGEGVFAGGDAVTGANNLISAVAWGKKAAVSIDKFLAGEEATLNYEPDPVAVKPEIVLQRAGNQPRQGRMPLSMRAAKVRKKDFGIYADTMTEEEAKAEAGRCLNCGCGIACGACYRVCMSMAISMKDGHYVIDREKCHACGMCFRRCPNMNIEMVKT
ncbi:MAG: hypothetical protein EHM13_11965 [Acidobacteria bacterium]|nr:MAG: hypothetical protein EHM13_11965 [Acidobacteriota bacterium]